MLIIVMPKGLFVHIFCTFARALREPFSKMCVKYKEDILPMLAFCAVIFLSITICETAVVCPNVSIGKGSSRVISCQSDLAISDFYWYQGHSNTTPILILDSEGKGGSEYGSEHFNISSNGSMILKNVLVKHESPYSFVGYYKNTKVGTATFFVNVTISPDPPCPLIHGCNSCIECNFFDPKKAGKLTCEIEGARPLLRLVWNIFSKQKIDFIKHHPKEERNLESDSWDTSVSLDYTIEDTCGVVGEVKCMAEDPSHILQSRITTVIIKTGSCSTAPSPSSAIFISDPTRPSASFSVTPIVLLCVVAIIIVGFVVGVCCIVTVLHRRCFLLRGGVKETLYFWLLPVLYRDTKVKLLIRLLKTAYDKYTKLTPLPWDDVSISVADLYTECECKVFNEVISSTNLLKNKKIRKEKRVVLIGEHGCGRTTLTKYIVQEWIQDKFSTCLLIYVPLREVKKGMKLSKVVMKGLPEHSSLEIKGIEKVLMCGKIRCLVILDGLEDLSKSCVESSLDEADDNSEMLTIEKLLKGDVGDQSNLSVWLTSRTVDYISSELSRVHSLRVDVVGLSKEQNLKYINKCCGYYCKDLPHDGKTDVDETPLLDENKFDNVSMSSFGSEVDSQALAAHRDESNNAGKSNLGSKISRRVLNFINRNDIVEDFGNTPLLLNIIVHVMAGKYTSAYSYINEKQIRNMGSLMRILIDCMEKRYTVKNGSATQNFDDLERKLGECAYQQLGKPVALERKVWVNNIGETDLNASRDIGLLKLSKSATSDATELADWANPSSTMEFYHPLIQAYLVAQYVVKNDCFASFLKNLLLYVDDTNWRVVMYVSGLIDESQMQDLCAALQRHQKYNILIDCLHENGNYTILQKIMKTSDNASVPVNHLDSVHHRKAAEKFCRQCKNLEINLHSISFEGNDLWSFLQDLTLPNVNIVEFPLMERTSTNYDEIRRWLSNQQVNAEPRFKDDVLADEPDIMLGESSGRKDNISTTNDVKYKLSVVDNLIEAESGHAINEAYESSGTPV